IYINLKGRQPQGCVEPGKEYEELCDEIVRRLREIRDPGTGKPVMEHIYKKCQIYSGGCSHFLPDICYSCKNYIEKGGSKFYSNKLIEKCSRHDISGTHALEGVALFYGNGINLNQKIEGLKLQDIAPLVLSALDLDIPDDMDGKAKEGIFQPGFLRVKYSHAKTDEDKGKHDYPQADAEGIKERLKGLGYIN
ncbi:hypothetical protein ACFL0P_04795, partial [Candidatus Omnitrophota bacterium]